MKFIINKYHFVVFGIFLAGAVYIRVWAAPLSAGPDVAQFWAFATVFHSHGIDFYRYASATDGSFPFWGWGYVYPPVWLLVLGICLLAASGSQATEFMVDSGWRLAMKVPLIAADVAIGCLLFWALSGSKVRQLIFTMLWLFHPTPWFESAVFGQFDVIAAAFLLASLIMLGRGKNWPAFFLASLAVMTKQHTLMAVALMIISIIMYIDRKQLIRYLLIFIGVIVIVSIPFLLTGNFSSYARSILLSASSPGYQEHVMYAFNGIGSLLTYLHKNLGWDTEALFQMNIPLLVVALLAAAIFVYRKRVIPIRAALVGLCLFIAFFYRINYQYLVIYIPIALLLAARTDYWSERIVTLGLVAVPAIWIWLSNSAFWFNYLQPLAPQVVPLLERTGLVRYDTPDYAYLAISLTIMALCLAYTLGTFLWWRRPIPGNTPPVLKVE
jgi:hypothetical protein